jgi:uncharacterized protein YuzE
MKFDYFADTDSLYIDLSERTSVESEEVAPGVVLDFDDKGSIVGIDIEHASKIVDLSRLESNSLPFAKAQLATAVAA